jgi:diacylglycerol kinase family enzyme
VEIDGDRVFSGPATTVAVCNGPRFGGGMLMAPDALPDDALLDVVVIGDVTKTDLALNLPRLYRGTHLSHPKVQAFRGREVKVASEASVPLEIDGEHPGTTPFHVWIEPCALRVVV